VVFALIANIGGELVQCRAYGAPTAGRGRRNHDRLLTQPFRSGLRFGGRPSGP
jgi:hypothetical protein